MSGEREWGVFSTYTGAQVGIGTTENEASAREDFHAWKRDGYPVELRVRDTTDWRPAGQPQAVPQADHPHADPGDGRQQCKTCGKWVWPVTHSCKGVRVAPQADGLSARERYAMSDARVPDCEMWVNGLTEVYDSAPDSDDVDRDQRIDISVSALAALVAEREVEAILADRAARDRDHEAKVGRRLAAVWDECVRRVSGADPRAIHNPYRSQP